MDIAFPHTKNSYFKWIFQLYILLKSLITNGFYLAYKLEALLQDVFRSNNKILNYLSATTIGIKISITISLIKLELFIFTNYNKLRDYKNSKLDIYSVLLGSVLV